MAEWKLEKKSASLMTEKYEWMNKDIDAVNMCRVSTPLQVLGNRSKVLTRPITHSERSFYNEQKLLVCIERGKSLSHFVNYYQGGTSVIRKQICFPEQVTF